MDILESERAKARNFEKFVEALFGQNRKLVIENNDVLLRPVLRMLAESVLVHSRLDCKDAFVGKSCGTCQCG